IGRDSARPSGEAAHNVKRDFPVLLRELPRVRPLHPNRLDAERQTGVSVNLFHRTPFLSEHEQDHPARLTRLMRSIFVDTNRGHSPYSSASRLVISDSA